MAVKMARIGFRLAIFTVVCVVGFYIGRPLYWKVSATLQEIREKDFSQDAVKQGLSDLVSEAQKSVGWRQKEIAEDVKLLRDGELKISESENSDEAGAKVSKDLQTEEDGKAQDPAQVEDVKESRRLARRVLQS